MNEHLTGYPSIDKPWLKYYETNIQLVDMPNKTLYEYAVDNNKDNFEGIAFNYYGKRITYNVFFANVRRTAAALIDSGIGYQDVVTIVSMQTPETITLFYALNYIGAIANMAYITLSEKEIKEMIIRTNSKAIFVLDIAGEKIDEIKKDIHIPLYVLSVKDSMPIFLKIAMGLRKLKTSKSYVTYQQFIGNAKEDVKERTLVSGDDVATIVYTSGTTGEPKGVMLTNNNINSLVFQYRHTDIHFQKGESFLDILPIFLGYGIGMMAIAICNGIETYLCLEPEPKKVSRQFKKVKPNHIELGKAHVLQIIEEWDGNAVLDFVINFAGGGDSLSLEEERKINTFLNEKGAKGRFVFGYGMTECASAVCTNSNYIYKEGSLGIPLPLTVIKVEDLESKKELNYNTTGELCVCAPNVMKGYFDNPVATESVIEVDKDGNKWIHTGDLGHIDEDGFVYLTGRIKRIFLAKGTDGLIYKLFPQRIEELFTKSNCDIKACAVIAKKDDEQYYKPIAFVKADDCSEEKKSKLVEMLIALAKEELPEYSIPEKIIVLNELPVTASGKINYTELEKYVK